MDAPYFLDPKEKNIAGNSALHVAIYSGKINAIILLVGAPYSVDPKEKNNNGNSVLHTLAMHRHVNAFSFFLQHYPAESKVCWVKNYKGYTPQDIGLQKKMHHNPLQLLRQCLINITQALAAGTSVDEKSFLLLSSFSEEWKNCLLDPRVNIDRAGLKSHLHLFAIHLTLIKILAAIAEKLNLIAINMENKSLTYVFFDNLLFLATQIEKKDRAFFASFSAPKHTFDLKQKLTQCFNNLATQDSPTLSSDALRTIHVLISDDERHAPHDNLKSVNAILKAKLLSTASLAAFRPQAMAKEIEISPENYVQHLEYMKSTFENLAVSAETRSITQEIIFPGIMHLINNIENIVNPVILNHENLYYLVPEKLPLHTNHTAAQDTQELRATLHRLLNNIIGAFYCCQAAGQLAEFFNRLGSGYCLEGRVRDVLAWAISFSERKSFDDFMADVISDYTAYSKVMDSMSDDRLSFIGPALTFIMSRYQDFPCQKNLTYAPENKIQRQGVKDYLQNILCYSPGYPEMSKSNIKK